MQYSSAASMSSFMPPSTPMNYMLSASQTPANGMTGERASQIRDSTLPPMPSDATTHWILNPFCSSAPLMTSGSQSEVASLLASNLLSVGNACASMNGQSLRSTFDAALASIALMANASTGKEVMRFKRSCLYAPKQNGAIASTRERPLGCRTIFVGGLPENTEEDILQEIFESVCGDICAIRMSKKNFCHIRFESEDCIEKAIALSGYRMKINDLEDAPNTGRLHIDYAQARDDQYDWECRQRALQREMRHRERLEYDRVCPPSPPSVHFSDHESVSLMEKLKCEQSFVNAIQVLVTWLERGECQKRNCGQFYTMIQTTYNHMRRLQNDRNAFENEWLNARQLYRTRMQTILVQLSQIEKVFEAAVRQKAWDHFTKAQRKHIDVWFKQTKELKTAHIDEVVNKREEDEMDLSDGDEDGEKKIDINCGSQSISKMAQLDELSDSLDPNSSAIESCEMSLRDENDTLKCQVESFRNEAVFVQAESQQEKESLEKQIEILQSALQGMQHQLITLSQQKRDDNLEIDRLKAALNETNRSNETEEDNCGAHQHDGYSKCKSAQLIGLISIYFNVHPFGITSEDICHYLKQQSHVRQCETLTPKFIDKFLLENPELFNQLEADSSGNKLWRFCGFQS